MSKEEIAFAVGRVGIVVVVVVDNCRVELRTTLEILRAVDSMGSLSVASFDFLLELY